MTCISLFNYHGWAIFTCLTTDGDIRKRFWIVKPIDGKAKYQKYWQKDHQVGHNYPRVLKDRNLTRKEVMRRWYLGHKMKSLQSQRIWRNNNPEKFREQQIRHDKYHSIPLNSWFLGADKHHISESYIIYIPRGLHQTVWHNLKTGEGMDDINMRAFGFLLWILGLSDNHA